MNILKGILKLFQSKGWEEVDRIPNWAWKRLQPYSLSLTYYRIAKGKHYLYKAWAYDDGTCTQGSSGEMRLFRKKRYNW